MESTTRSRSDTGRAIATIGLAALLIAAVAYNLIVPGPFEWHVGLPEVQQGLLEVVGLFVVLLLVLHSTRLPRGWRWLLLALPCAFYLRRHHVDLALLMVLVYVEGLFALGMLVLGRARAAYPEHDEWLRCFLAGIATMALLLWLAQLGGYGLPRTQRLLAALVLLPALLIGWRRLRCACLLRSMLDARSWSECAWWAALLAFVLMLFARSNVVVGSDSLWYGLRPDRVLVGARSVFEPLGFASPVYYFPKLYEVLLLPLSASRENSVVLGFAIACGAAIATTVYAILRRGLASRSVALAGAMLAWSIPALANACLSAKPDVFTALMVIAMVWFAGSIAAGRRGDMLWAIACALLAVSSKLVAFPYVAAAGLACLVALHAARAQPRSPPDRGALPVLAIAFVVAILVAARTWWTSGMPTIGPEPLVALWRALGMQFHPPVGTLQWMHPQNWSDVPAIVAGWLLAPSTLSHIQIAWPSNVWVFLPLAALLWRRSERAVPTWTLWAVPAAGLAMLIGIGFSNRGGDGNYFIAPVVLATLATWLIAQSRATSATAATALMASAALFVAFHVAYGFVSAAWSPGTRALDLDLMRSNRDTPARDAEFIRRQGLDGVEAHLRERGDRPRVAGITVASGGFRLAARYDNLDSMVVANRDRSDTLGQMQYLLACGGVQALLIPLGAEPSPYPGIAAIVAWASAMPASEDAFADARWRLIPIADLLPACSDRHDPPLPD